MRRTVVGQYGGAASAEVQRQPSDIFLEHKNQRLTGRRRAVSIGSNSDKKTRRWDARLRNRSCKCILVVDQAPVPYRGISNRCWLWWRDRFHNLPDADNASHPAIVVDDR
jgi:hypothetical protein